VAANRSGTNRSALRPRQAPGFEPRRAQGPSEWWQTGWLFRSWHPAQSSRGKGYQPTALTAKGESRRSVACPHHAHDLDRAHDPSGWQRL
jgi:hypothetical protein